VEKHSPVDKPTDHAPPPVTSPAPLAVTIPEGCRISGLSRSEIYRRLAAGDIRAVKSGTRTLVLMDSLRAHVASLPAATFGGRRRGPGAARRATGVG